MIPASDGQILAIVMSDADLKVQLAHYRGIKAFWDDADRATVASLIEQMQAEVEIRREAYRRAAIALRDQLGCPGAASALEALAEALRPLHEVCMNHES